jgi:LEA14-like dessication related protein
MGGKIMNRISSIAASLLLGAALAACSALPMNAEQPKISVADINLASAGLLEQKFTLGLRIQNPNDFELAVNAISFDLELNGKPFVSGLSGKAVSIGKFSSGVMQVEGISNGFALLNQALDVAKGEKKTFSYRLKGTARIGDNFMRLPFDQKVEIELPKIFASTDKSAS